MAANVDLQTFGFALRESRGRSGRSQQEVGAALGVSGSAVGSWERGEVEPERKHVFALEELLIEPPGRFSRILGYEPPTHDVPRLSASGVDLEELRRADPDAYDDVMELARRALERARARRQGR